MDKPAHQFCPHLGIKSDPTTSFSYPSKGHVCFHAKKTPTPELEYQRSTCLTVQHLHCPVYKSPSGARLPDDILEPGEAMKVQPKYLLWGFLIILLGLGVFLGVRYRESIITQVEGIIIPAWRQTQQSMPATLPPTATIVPSATITPQPTQTATLEPEPTPTPSSTWRPAVIALGTPIGSEIQFVIQRVNEGESLGQFANRYNTTEAAIRAVNYNMPSVLFIDLVIVIPVDITDPDGLPTLQPIQMETSGLSVESFAVQLGVDPEEMSRYNNVTPDRILGPGEWILVPRD